VEVSSPSFSIDSELARGLMAKALTEARLAFSEGEVPAGAAVADSQGNFLASGRNRVIALLDPSAHAEILALRAAARIAKNYRLSGAILVSTIEPCPMCLMAAIHARVGYVFYGAMEPKWGAAHSHLNLHENAWLNHHPLVEGGLRADECAMLIRDFFKAKRVKT
jgi:tRNA(Arg) A34 adenosine deaminase TadA